jgi:hypothetical protein
VIGVNQRGKEPAMELGKLFSDLFSTDYGLLSLGVIVFILVMAAWFWHFFTTKMAEPPPKQ